MSPESVSFAFQDRHYVVDCLGQDDDWQFTRVMQESTSTRTDPHHRTIWSDRRPISKTIRPILDQAEIRVRRQAHTLYLDPHAAILWEAYGTLIGGPNETFFRSYIRRRRRSGISWSRTITSCRRGRPRRQSGSWSGSGPGHVVLGRLQTA